MSAGDPAVRVLLVDDHRLVVEAMRKVLDGEPEIKVVGTAGSLADLRRLGDRPDVVIMDYLLPDGTGADGIRVAKMKWPRVRVVMLTAVQSDETILETVGAGADGYLTKDRALADVVDAVHVAAAGAILLPRSVLMEISRRVSVKQRPEPRVVERLSPRELEVLRALGMGESSPKIASRLGISVDTVRTHVAAILRKLSVHSKLEAVTVALRLGLIEAPR